jgi:hypothetical protein
MLTRLCRRQVVEDWGGFAPYFVRHAKQFAETRETIEAKAQSVETWAAKIAYNMIADETAIEINTDIAAIADKHLGAELEHNQIFAACQNLIAELREYFKAKGETGSGEVEDAIAGGLEELVKEQKEAAKNNAEKEDLMRDSMGDFADFMDQLYEHNANSGPGAESSKISKLGEIENELHQLKYKEKLAQQLKNLAKEMASVVEKGAAESTLEYLQQQVAST